MTFKGVSWADELDAIKLLDSQGNSMVDIAKLYGVTRQRVKQIFNKYNITQQCWEIERVRRRGAYERRWGNINQDNYDAKRDKWRRKRQEAGRLGIEFTLDFCDVIFPTHCPILGIELEYEAETAQEGSPSFCRINPKLGYTKENVRIVSWRANRIKNNGSSEELRKIADFLDILQ